jgi:hypothetical protein
MLFVSAVSLLAFLEILQHHSSQPVVGHLSWKALVGAGLALMITIAFGLGALAGGLGRAEFAVDSFHRASVRRTAWVLGFLGLSCWLVATYRVTAVPAPLSPDEEDYLRLAELIRQQGGVGPLLGNLYGGTFQEANRHPLYPVAVSVFDGATAARALSLVATGVAALLAACAAGSLGGLSLALPVFLVTACSGAMLRAASSVLAEGFLCAGLSGLWYVLHLATRSNARAEAPGRSQLWGLLGQGNWGVVAGALGAWLYLSKGTGLLWFAVAVLAMLFCRRVWMVVSAAVVAILLASPLWVRNQVLYGNPVYNFNQKFLFADSFEEGLSSQQAAMVKTALSAYWESHTWAEILDRLRHGVAWELYIVARGIGPAGPEGLRVLLGMLLLSLAVVGFLTRRWVLADGVAAGWLLAGFVCFGWYVPIAASERFLLPLYGVLASYAVLGAWVLATRWRWLRPCLVTIGLGGLWAAISAVSLLLGSPSVVAPRL